ncbi:lysoplasmalogenase [Legionella longbeachae]|uniref:Putative transmembrane protein n=1 Tax=Legionella longbeachae serogroup 1 (strain NSW150) TaxID=661367 RepID=D3HPG2_LEGLN|nr:lysoplasmalogenase [Legionella longbeachae]VEE01302.1 transmembrane protein [Legionella oakridgensis]HBD7398262.1 lysoplasmalogenase [Legionella pneumophila]ARB92333.1 lysoplasmalogenase [Legionella longbeachae]ARM34486.1 lysoplasmalogenase [Legionella longbeachae]EEZ96220.1 putative membrane protein [Legionella longbeachae D-4968]
MPGQPFKIPQPLILGSMIFYLILLPFIQYPLTTLLKPLPVILLILYTLQATLEQPIKFFLLGALSFSCIGDIVLTLPIKAALQAGILAFMAAHCAYICLFLKEGQFQKKNFFPFLPILLFVLIGGYFLWPYLGEMKKPVLLYLFLLTCMVFCSFQVRQQSFLIRLGACLFLLSDFTLALDLFVLTPIKPLAVLIMFLYYLAQFLLVTGTTHRTTQNLKQHSPTYS